MNFVVLKLKIGKNLALGRIFVPNSLVVEDFFVADFHSGQALFDSQSGQTSSRIFIPALFHDFAQRFGLLKKDDDIKNLSISLTLL